MHGNNDVNNPQMKILVAFVKYFPRVNTHDHA